MEDRVRDKYRLWWHRLWVRTGRSIANQYSTAHLGVLLLWMVLCPVSSAHAGTPNRIVSLSPATTEILFDIGLGDRIVGVTSFCDHPAEARTKTKIGGMSNPSLEAIISLRPDLVVMTTDGNPREVEERLQSLNVQTYVWTARKIRELPDGIRRLSSALGVEGRGDDIAKGLERKLRSLRETRHERLESAKALYIVWPEPLLVAGPGTAIHDALVLLGMRNIAEKAVTSYPRYSIEEVIREAPDVLFIGAGSGMDMREVSGGLLRKLSPVPAVQKGKVCFVSDNLYRLTPRAIEGIGELKACIE